MRTGKTDEKAHSYCGTTVCDRLAALVLECETINTASATIERACAVHQGQLHEAGSDDTDARRREALRLYLRAEGHLAEVPHPADAHALHCRALRTRLIHGVAGAVGAVRLRELHFRLRGRAWEMDVRGRFRRRAPAHRQQARTEGDRRKLRCLRHN